MLEEYYSGVAKELLAKLRRLSSFTGHAASVGASHEEFVREAIRPLLSRRFSLRTGFLFAGKGIVSPQSDILIVDENDPSPFLYQLGDLVVVHPRAVAMVIEVKTRLTKPEFHGALRALRECRHVATLSNPPGGFATAVFAYESAQFTPDTLDDWYKSAAVPDDLWSYPQLIYSLTAGALQAQHIGGDVVGHRFLMGEESDEAKARSLSIFLQIVRKALETKAGMETNVFEFANLDGLVWSGAYLRLGVGLVEEGGNQPAPGQLTPGG